MKFLIVCSVKYFVVYLFQVKNLKVSIMLDMFSSFIFFLAITMSINCSEFDFFFLLISTWSVFTDLKIFLLLLKRRNSVSFSCISKKNS